jgi:hypothetical protein
VLMRVTPSADRIQQYHRSSWERLH